jgi:hypothetical protein
MLQAMFVTDIKLATMIVLLALIGNGACLSDAGNEDTKGLAEASFPMFPDGFDHDFGKVMRGTEAKHVFRIVNTSAVPLHIVSLRFG